jgi:mono/diheme cytochrome c family protein
MAEALVSGLPANELDWSQKLTQSKEDSTLYAVLEKSLSNLHEEAIQTPQFYTQLVDDDRTNGLKLFKTTCATCHGLDGQGIPQLAPSLAASDIMKNSEVQVASFILNGYQKEGSAFNAPMPSYIADPNFSNQDIVDLLRYLKSAFTDGWSQIRVEQVDSLRKASPLYVQ